MSAAGPEPVGELAGELRRLLDAVLARAAASPDGPPGGAAEQAPDCGWCPVCAVVSALRGERPELARRLGEHGAGLAATLRALVEEHEHGRAAPDQHGQPAARPEQREPEPADDNGEGAPVVPRPRVQRIAVRTSGGGTR